MLALGEAGYKEVTLLGQNIDAYGRDLPGMAADNSGRRANTFTDLLRHVHDVPGVCGGVRGGTAGSLGACTACVYVPAWPSTTTTFDRVPPVLGTDVSFPVLNAPCTPGSLAPLWMLRRH